MKHIFMVAMIAVQLWTCGAIAADQITPLTLKQAWTFALQNHPRIQSDEFMTRAAEQDIEIARSNYFPQIWGDAVGVDAPNGTRLAATNGINNPSIISRGALGFSITQLITNFGRTGHLVDAAQSRVKAEAARTEETRDQVLLEVTRAYYDTLRAQALLQVAVATLAARNDFFEQITVMRNVGRRSDLDLSIARQEVAEAKLLQTQAQGGVDNAFAVLSQALGFGEQRRFSLQAATLEPVPSGFDALARQAIEQNPQLRELRAEAQAARRAYEAERALNYPTVNAVGYAGITPLREAGTIDENYSAAGIVLSVPIFTGGKLSAAGQKAELEADAKDRELQMGINEVIRDLRIAWNDLHAAYASIDATQQMLDSSNEALDLTLAGYQLGRNSIVDLSLAKLNRIRAEISNVNALYDYLIQRATLEYKMGTLDAASL